MYEQFRNELRMKLAESFPVESIEMILSCFDRIAVNYNFSVKETHLVPQCRENYELAKMFLACKRLEGLSDLSIRHTGYSLRYFLDTVQKPIREITTNDIRFFLASYQQTRNVQAVTVNNMQKALNGFFTWLRIEEYIDKAPTDKVSRIKFIPNKRKALTQLQLEKCRQCCLTLRERAILELFYSTGARVSEIARLDISNVDFVSQSVIVKGKGSKYYTVYINDKAKLYLQQYLESRKDCNEGLFVSTRGSHKMSRESYEKLFREIGKRANLEFSLTPHVLRHTMATTAFNNGAPIEEVSHMLNHASISTTQIYIDKNEQNTKMTHIRTVV